MLVGPGYVGLPDGKHAALGRGWHRLLHSNLELEGGDQQSTCRVRRANRDKIMALECITASDLSATASTRRLRLYESCRCIIDKRTEVMRRDAYVTATAPFQAHHDLHMLNEFSTLLLFSTERCHMHALRHRQHCKTYPR
jgi:hypothetical protein